MNTAFKTTNSNAYIDSLERFMSAAGGPVRWLVVTHDDQRLARPVYDALSGEAVATIRAPQHTWSSASDLLAEAVDWAICQSEIRNLVFVGYVPLTHHTGTPEPTSEECSSTPSAERPRGFDRLRAGAQHHTAMNLRAQQQFAADVRRITNHPSIKRAMDHHQLTVQGLLYRAAHGCFVAYDVRQDAFRALV